MVNDLVELPEAVPGTRRSLRIRRFGRPGARPKAYLQAGLHGDELPGILVLDHLERLLEAAKVEGEIVLVPLANPIGLSQTLVDRHFGRYDLANLSNFNRGWPDLVDAVAAEVGPALGPDPATNVATIREALVRLTRALPAGSENAALRRTLFAHAIDADYVLDLHCDLEAVMHVYLGTPLWPDAADLAGAVRAEAVLLAERSGGHPFDEACSAVWWDLQRRFPDRPIPNACLSATIEYRGLSDVEDGTAAADAQGLLAFLVARGVVAAELAPPAHPTTLATPLTGVAMVRAPQGGLVCFKRRPGEEVEEGDCLAEILDPLAADAASRRAQVPSPIAGRIFARAQMRLARTGDILVKVAGASPLPDRKGSLLTD